MNGYLNHDEWKSDWTAKRNNQFYVLGSKDETSGCQGCVMTVNPDGTYNLQLRLMDKLITKSSGKHAEIKNISIKYGVDVIRKALQNGQALSYRFLRDDKGWRVLISTDGPEVQMVSIKHAGKIGIDINADCLAATEIDRFGNLVNSEVIHLVTYGKNADQAEAIIGDAVKITVDLAIKACKPIVIEKLKFSKKQAELEGENPKSARMLSSFAYNKIIQSIKSRAYRFGIEVIEVNAAYTSIIGLVNYSKKLGISTHQAAAFAIARRGSGFRERPIQEKEATIPTPKGDHVTFSLPARNREKHVWSFWSEVKKSTTAVLAAHIRPPNGDPAKKIKPKTSKRKCPVFSVRSRNASQQNCSADEMDAIPW
jgi:IS605 OrfB family transposase